jgi:chaperonin cofactor prefoldin
MGMKETIVEALKDLVLPELDELKGELKRQGVRLEAVERRLDDFAGRFQGIDQHLIDQSRRIDELRTELTTRIDKVHTELIARTDNLHADLVARTDKVDADLTARIDQQSIRIDSLTTQMAALAQELAGLRRDQQVQGDILQRLRRLEDKVAA